MSGKSKDGGPAFPNSVQPDFQWAEAGMTLRDYFAGQALTGIVQRRWEDDSGNIPANIYSLWAGAAYQTADAMIAAALSEGKDDGS